jgi:hypothetical protein
VADDDEFLMVKKSITSLGGEVKPSVPCHKFYSMSKIPTIRKEIFIRYIHESFSPSFFLLYY